MHRRQAIEVVGALMAPYRVGATIAKETVDAYIARLEDLDYDVAMTAANRLVETSKWLPAISEVRTAAAQLVDPLPEPDEAWAEVQTQMRAAGWTGTPRWSHPAIAETVRAMGWRELCQADRPGVDRAQFQRMYAARRLRQTERQSLSPDVRELVDAIGQQTALAADRRRELPPVAVVAGASAPGPRGLAAVPDVPPSRALGLRPADEPTPAETPTPRRYTRQEFEAEMASRGIPVADPASAGAST